MTILLFAGGFFFFRPPLVADETNLVVTADRMEFNSNERSLHAEGQVILTAGDCRLKAGEMKVLLGKKYVHAWRKVSAEQGPFWAFTSWIGLDWSSAPRFFDKLGTFSQISQARREAKYEELASLVSP